MPILTILLPTSNRGRVLMHSLPDLKQQLQGLLEDGTCQLVISDNCSQDDTLEVCNSMFGDIPAVTIVSQPKFMDVESHHRQCLSYANGEFVLYLGDDDQIRGEAVSRICKLLPDSQAEIVACCVSGIHETDQHLQAHPANDEAEIEKITTDGSLMLSLLPSLGFLLTSIFRKTVLQKSLDLWIDTSQICYARLCIVYQYIKIHRSIHYIGINIGHGNKYQYLLSDSSDYSQKYSYYLKVLSVNRMKAWHKYGVIGDLNLDRHMYNYCFSSLFINIDRNELSAKIFSLSIFNLLNCWTLIFTHPFNVCKVIALGTLRILKIRS